MLLVGVPLAQVAGQWLDVWMLYNYSVGQAKMHVNGVYILQFTGQKPWLRPFCKSVGILTCTLQSDARLRPVGGVCMCRLQGGRLAGTAERAAGTFLAAAGPGALPLQSQALSNAGVPSQTALWRPGAPVIYEWQPRDTLERDRSLLASLSLPVCPCVVATCCVCLLSLPGVPCKVATCCACLSWLPCLVHARHKLHSPY